MQRFFQKFFRKKDTNLAPAELNKYPKPNHLAMIMDGNGRWAQRRGLPRAAGHRAGVETLREVVKTCSDLGISYLTVYAFSTENWKRPQEEINALMDLLVESLENELASLNKNKVRMKAIGNIGQMPATLVKRIKKAEEDTADNQRLFLQIALNYGGRKDILNAIRELGHDFSEGKLNPENLNEEIFSRYLATAGIPEPDLLIRTAGEKRLSNFLLWECAYTELWFTDVFWPDFRAEHLFQAIADFQQRQRRFGGLIKNEG